MNSSATLLGARASEPAHGTQNRRLLSTPIGRRGPIRRSLGFGILGALGMLALYLGIVALAESWAHALQLIREDALLVVPIIVGFGLQMGLFSFLRSLTRLRGPGGAEATLAGASGGTSTLGMVACCAHHLTDVLPIVGLSGATVFLAEYKVPFMVAGLVTNLVAIVALSIQIRRTSRHTSHLGEVSQ